jgi:hypothetical protein
MIYILNRNQDSFDSFLKGFSAQKGVHNFMAVADSAVVLLELNIQWN